MQASDSLPKEHEGKHARWLVPLLLIAPIIAIFAPVIFADRSFVFRDGAHFYHPLFQWISAEWGAGRVPLWNPLENCGMPVLADATSSIFYPGKLVFALPLPFVWNYKLYIIGHVVLAALGMYVLARRLKASQPAAVIAAIAYACGGNVIFQYCNVVFLVGAAWLPAALLATEVIVASNCRRATVGLAVVLAMMILGGDPQMAYHVLLAAGLRLVCSWFVSIDKKADSPPLEVLKPASSSSTWWQPIPLLAGAAIIAALLAAVQILPSSEATKTSERAAYNKPRNIYEATAVLMKDRSNASLLDETPGEAITAGIFGKPEPTSHHDRAYDFSIAPWRIIEFVWPNVTGKIMPTNRRWTAMIRGESKPWTPSMYLGLLPLLAGAVAMRLWRTTPTVRWLTSLVTIFALGSLGWFGFGWLLRELYTVALNGDPNKILLGSGVGGVYWLMVTCLPTYVYFRYPAKLMVVAVCALCALSAPAIDRLLVKPPLRLMLLLQWFTIGSGGLAFAAWVGLSLVKGTAYPRPNPVFGDFDIGGMRWDVIGGFLHGAIVAWLLSYLLKRYHATSSPLAAKETAAKESRTPTSWLMVALTAAELAIANYGLVVSAPAELWSRKSPAAAALTSSADGTARYFRGSYHQWHPLSFQETNSQQRMAELEGWQHDTLFPKYHLATGLPLVESYGSLKSLDYESLMLVARTNSQTVIGGARVPAAEALRLTACESLVLPAEAKLKFADPIALPAGISLPENVSLWRMKRTLPRAYIVPRVVLLPPLDKTLDIGAVDQRAREVLTAKNAGGIPAFRDFREVAVVEATALGNAALLQPESQFVEQPTCELVVDTPQQVRVRAKLDQPGLLVLADTFAPGWVAYVEPAAEVRLKPERQRNRQMATIHRTNRCFRGVELAAGEWIIDFEYRPGSFYLGGSVSAVAWLGLLACLVTALALRLRGSSRGAS